MEEEELELVEYPDGTKTWYLNGRPHRIDGPAVIRVNGTKSWYINGLRHRTDGPAIEYSDGTKRWYLNGNLHRLDGPAIEDYNGTKMWYVDRIHYGYDDLTTKEFMRYLKAVREWKKTQNN